MNLGYLDHVFITQIESGGVSRWIHNGARWHGCGGWVRAAIQWLVAGGSGSGCSGGSAVQWQVAGDGDTLVVVQ